MPRPFYRLWRHWILMAKDKADIIDLVQGEEIFQTIPEHNSVKDTREKGQKNM